jgi:hypothetical protein
MIKAGTATVTYLAAYLSNLGSLSSILSPNLAALGGEEGSIKTFGGTGLSLLDNGKTQNEVMYVGNNDQGTVFNTVNQQAKQTSSEILQVDVDEEKEKMKKTQDALVNISDKMDFVVQLLNEDGIKIRYYPIQPGSGENPVAKTPALDLSSGGFFINGGY